ncbi:MAG: threonine-phosphate decarboxylase CobD [Synechococcales bacterium]|nr:threonine-phosphate decarboxylase CobD [Synechococcales bacterium]
MKQPSHGGNLTWAARLAGCSPQDLLDFSASINPLGIPQTAIAAIQSHLADLRAYPDPNYEELRQALGQHHGIGPEWICPGNGSAELLTWVSRELAQLDQTRLLTPAFGDYGRSLRAFGATIVPCLLSDLDAYPAGFGANFGNHPPDAPRCRAVVLPELSPLARFTRPINRQNRPPQPLPSTEEPPQNANPPTWGILLNNPHNPTGRLFAAASILPYLEQCDLVVVDEAFMDFLPPDQQQSLIPQVMTHANLVVLRSLTKFYSLPGLRIGYAITHPDRIQRWQQWRDPWSVNTLAAVAAIAVLQDHDFQRATYDWLPPARSQLFAGLQRLSGLQPLPGAANYLLVACQPSAVALQHSLLKAHRILIRDCVSFPELGDRFFRVAVRTAADHQQLLTGLAAILGNHDR